MSAQAVPGARTALLNGIGGGTIAGVVALARYRTPEKLRCPAHACELRTDRRGGGDTAWERAGNPLTAGHAAVGTFTLIAMLDWCVGRASTSAIR